jgi:hypothetical protein
MQWHLPPRGTLPQMVEGEAEAAAPQQYQEHCYSSRESGANSSSSSLASRRRETVLSYFLSLQPHYLPTLSTMQLFHSLLPLSLQINQNFPASHTYNASIPSHIQHIALPCAVQDKPIQESNDRIKTKAS